MQIATAATTATVPTPPAAPGGGEPEFAALVAIDWADEKHQVMLLPAGSEQKESFTLEQKPEVLSDWVAQLHKRFGEGKIAVKPQHGAFPFTLPDVRGRLGLADWGGLAHSRLQARARAQR